MHPGLQPLIDAVRQVAIATPGLVAAYVFGSTMVPGARPRDLDVALLFEEGVPDAEVWSGGESFALRLERVMPAPRRCVDVVELRRAPPSLLVRILREGVRVGGDDKPERVRFEAEALSRATDFLEWQKPFVDRWLARVSNGG